MEGGGFTFVSVRLTAKAFMNLGVVRSEHARQASPLFAVWREISSACTPDLNRIKTEVTSLLIFRRRLTSNIGLSWHILRATDATRSHNRNPWSVATLVVQVRRSYRCRSVSPKNYADVVFRASITVIANFAFRSVVDRPCSSPRECDGPFLIALISLIERRRMVALNTQIGELTDRLANLEVAESRRLAIEVRTKTRDISQGLAKDVQRTADSLEARRCPSRACPSSLLRARLSNVWKRAK